VSALHLILKSESRASVASRFVEFGGQCPRHGCDTTLKKMRAGMTPGPQRWRVVSRLRVSRTDQSLKFTVK
jgi:hypothetical protein